MILAEWVRRMRPASRRKGHACTWRWKDVTRQDARLAVAPTLEHLLVEAKQDGVPMENVLALLPILEAHIRVLYGEPPMPFSEALKRQAHAQSASDPVELEAADRGYTAGAVLACLDGLAKHRVAIDACMVAGRHHLALVEGRPALQVMR